ncbi:MAG TPA: alpha/beta hydrolase, partial [Rhodanobacter sp.]
RSDVVSQATIDEFLHLVPQAEHVQLPDATHMLAGDANDAFTSEVARFVFNLASPGVRSRAGATQP